MFSTFRSIVTIATVALTITAVSLAAHPMTVKGTVAAVGAKKIQVKTGEEKQGEAPAWFTVDAKTKIFRDKTEVTFDAAKIKTGERVVITADHEADGVMRTVEVRLAAAAQ